MTITWKNPLANWGINKEIDHAQTNAWTAPQTVWDKTRASATRMFKVGRLRYYYKSPGHGATTWNRWRYPFTRRRVLNLRGEYNRKNLRREKTLADRRPVYWMLSFIALLLAPLAVPESMQSTVLSASAVFFIYAAINLCWTLVIGTAGIFSLATMAIVGAAAYGTAYLSVEMGLPWWAMPPVGAAIGLVFGLVIAVPANRLDGFYYALLTLGLVELCRVYVVQSRTFGSSTGGVYGAESYVPDSLSELDGLRLSYYVCFAVMIGALFVFRFIHGKRLGRILRMAPEKREAFAEATGVNFKLARIQVFIITSVVLGALGGFYASHFHGASPSLFTMDSVLLGLAMLVIGGLGRSEGAVLGTLIVVFMDKVLIDLGPLRLILIGTLMLMVVLLLRGGLFGIKQQFRAWRNKKKSENRSTRAEKGGEMLPEEATEIKDKDIIYMRRFDKMQRDFLKTLVTEEVIEEHRRSPLGQHSEALERLLNYFRRQPQVDKYAIVAIELYKSYRIIAMSGQRGVAPRIVEDRIYATEEEAYHAVFLRRAQDLLET
jgi:branched-chain amino acid transport system permease protein